MLRQLWFNFRMRSGVVFWHRVNLFLNFFCIRTLTLLTFTLTFAARKSSRARHHLQLLRRTGEFFYAQKPSTLSNSSRFFLIGDPTAVRASLSTVPTLWKKRRSWSARGTSISWWEMSFPPSMSSRTPAACCEYEGAVELTRPLLLVSFRIRCQSVFYNFWIQYVRANAFLTALHPGYTSSPVMFVFVGLQSMGTLQMSVVRLSSCAGSPCLSLPGGLFSMFIEPFTFECFGFQYLLHFGPCELTM